MRTQGEPCLSSFTPKVNSQGAEDACLVANVVDSICQQLGTYAILIGIEICNHGYVFPMTSMEQLKTDCRYMP